MRKPRFRSRGKGRFRNPSIHRRQCCQRREFWFGGPAYDRCDPVSVDGDKVPELGELSNQDGESDGPDFDVEKIEAGAPFSGDQDTGPAGDGAAAQ